MVTNSENEQVISQTSGTAQDPISKLLRLLTYTGVKVLSFILVLPEFEFQ